MPGFGRPMMGPQITSVMGSQIGSVLSPQMSFTRDWPVPGFHHDFALLSEQPSPAVEYQTYTDSIVVSSAMSPPPELEGPGAVMQASEDTAAVLAPQARSAILPSLLPPPVQPPFLFFGGDPERFFHFVHDLQARSLPDETSLGPQGDTSQPDEVTISPSSTPASVQTQGSSLTGQIAPMVTVAPVRLTSLFDPVAGRDDQSLRLARGGESSSNMPAEMVATSLPKSGLPLPGTGESSVNSGDGSTHPGDDLLPNGTEKTSSGSQTKLLLPQAAGLIARAVPFDQAALEQAVDQFFEKLEDLGVGQLVEQGPTRRHPDLSGIACAVSAVEIARRRLKSKTGERQATESKSPLGSEELLGFPELPGSWSTNLT